MIPTRQQVEQLRAAASALRHTPPEMHARHLAGKVDRVRAEMEREVERDEDAPEPEDRSG